MTEFFIQFFTGHAGVMGQNALLATLGGLVAFYYGRMGLRTPKGDPVRRLSFGIAAGGIGWAIHRSYWWFWRFELSRGRTENAQWFKDNADWLLLVIVVIIASYLIHLANWSRQMFGRWHWAVSIFLCLLAFLLGAWQGVDR